MGESSAMTHANNAAALGGIEVITKIHELTHEQLVEVLTDGD